MPHQMVNVVKEVCELCGKPANAMVGNRHVCLMHFKVAKRFSKAIDQIKDEIVELAVELCDTFEVNRPYEVVQVIDVLLPQIKLQLTMMKDEIAYEVLRPF